MGITTYEPGVDGYVSLFVWGPVYRYAPGVDAYAWPYPTEADRYVQKVWDPVTGDWEKWETAGFADYSGQQYPFGQAQYAGTSQYRVVEIFHTRNVI